MALAVAVVVTHHCHCYTLPGRYAILVAQEAAHLRPQGDVSCAAARQPLAPWTGSLESFVTFSGCLQDSFNAHTAFFRTIHCLCLCNQIAQSQFCAAALVALAEIRAPVEAEGLPHVVATQAL